MSDFLDARLQEIRDRLTELRPLVDEFHRLEGAADLALNAAVDEPAATRRARSQPGGWKPRSGRRGRPKGSGTRAAQALEVVRAQRGITIPELAAAIRRAAVDLATP